MFGNEFVYVPIKKQLLERIQDLSELTNIEIYQSQPYEDFVNNILVTEKLRLEKILSNVKKCCVCGTNKDLYSQTAENGEYATKTYCGECLPD